jgi:hypothetical protein
MNKFLSDKNKIKLISLATYQIGGGIFGIIITIQLLLDAEEIKGLVVFLILIALGLFAFSIYCGLCLIKNKLHRGLKLSTINQAIQTISFTMFGYGYKFCSGIFLYLGVDLTNAFNVSFKLRLSNWYFIINSDKEVLTVGINIVAFYLLYFISKLEGEIEVDRKLFETSEQVNSPTDASLKQSNERT